LYERACRPHPHRQRVAVLWCRHANGHRPSNSSNGGRSSVAIRRISRPAAVARRAAQRVANRQLPQAYPPQRGIGKRATKENARTASLAVERWDFRRHGLKRPLGNAKKAAPDVDRGPHALAARHRVRLSLVSLASQQSPTPFHQAQELTMTLGSDSRQIASGRLSPCL
jgi:hypothetical protein